MLEDALIRFAASILFSAFAACVALPTGAFAQESRPLRIGVITFLSGPAAGPFGVPAKNAAEVLAEAFAVAVEQFFLRERGVDRELARPETLAIVQPRERIDVAMQAQCGCQILRRRDRPIIGLLVEGAEAAVATDIRRQQTGGAAHARIRVRDERQIEHRYADNFEHGAFVGDRARIVVLHGAARAASVEPSPSRARNSLAAPTFIASSASTASA